MTQTWRACKASATSRTRRSIGLPARGCSTLGNDERMRVPSPAARTTTVRGVVGGTICIASVVGEKRVVARLGFEPRQTDSKSVVLPLHNLATQKHYSTNHLPDAKKWGDEFLGESFHYLAQRTQRAWRQSSLSTLLHTSYFTLPTSYSVIPCRVLAPGVWNLRGVPTNECHLVCYLSRTEHAEGAEENPNVIPCRVYRHP